MVNLNFEAFFGCKSYHVYELYPKHELINFETHLFLLDDLTNGGRRKNT